MKKTYRPVYSLALILAGCLCFAVPFIVEALDQPRLLPNEAELPDPSPPDFSYIPLEDFLETRASPAPPEASADIDEPDALPELPDILPGDNEPDEEEETPEPAQVVQPKAPVYVLLGVVKIPRLDVSENMFEGTEKQMKYGIGHLEGTPLPGERGNSVIAAHRISTTGRYPFKHIDKLAEGDRITVTLGEEVYTYEVFDNFIVSMHDLWVLQPERANPYLLTLVTCDPIVSATRRVNRLIVRARLVRDEETEGG